MTLSTFWADIEAKARAGLIEELGEIHFVLDPASGGAYWKAEHDLRWCKGAAGGVVQGINANALLNAARAHFDADGRKPDEEEDAA